MYTRAILVSSLFFDTISGQLRIRTNLRILNIDFCNNTPSLMFYAIFLRGRVLHSSNLFFVTFWKIWRLLHFVDFHSMIYAAVVNHFAWGSMLFFWGLRYGILFLKHYSLGTQAKSSNKLQTFLIWIKKMNFWGALYILSLSRFLFCQIYWFWDQQTHLK